MSKITCKEDAFNLILEMRDLLCYLKPQTTADEITNGLDNLKIFLGRLGQVGFMDITNHKKHTENPLLATVKCLLCFKEFTFECGKGKHIVCPSCGQKKIG